jgi:hypothetical protein
VPGDDQAKIFMNTFAKMFTKTKNFHKRVWNTDLFVKILMKRNFVKLLLFAKIQKCIFVSTLMDANIVDA